MISKPLLTSGGKALFVLSALLLSQAALAESRAAACAGCGSADMKRLAQRLVDNGTATIFDAVDGQVETYRVFTQYIPGRYGRNWSSARMISTDPGVKHAWDDFLYAMEGLGDGDAVVLPPDFPVRSVAGALLDPTYATTGIENYLLTLPQKDQADITLRTLASRLKDIKTPLFDLENIVSSVVLTIEFPDGSRMDFTISFSADQLNLEVRIELKPHGNATLEDGTPAPTSALGFRNRTFRDNGGSLVEWVALARSFGVPVVRAGSGGGGDDTTMECTVEGSTITCTVKHEGR